MNRPGHESVHFFTGTEIEQSPAFGRRTLFVVGLQPVEQILWRIGQADQKHANKITHVYFGANQSFPNPAFDDRPSWYQWTDMIQAVLAKGYWCTLDLDVSSTEGLCESGLTEHARFIPMISVKLPYIQLLGYNATVKLDDRDFEATNPGVWCHGLHNLMHRDRFTAWDAYTKDETLQ